MQLNSNTFLIRIPLTNQFTLHVHAFVDIKMYFKTCEIGYELYQQVNERINFKFELL